MAPMGVVACWISSSGGGDDGHGSTSEADDMVAPLLSRMKEGGGRCGGGGSTIMGECVFSTTDGTAKVVRWRCTASSVIDNLIDWRRLDCDCEGSG